MPFDFVLFRYFWVLFIVVTFLNGFIMKWRARTMIAENPSLEPGYQKLFNGWVTYGNIPWIIMGIGVLMGWVEGVFDYLLIGTEVHPIVYVFHLSVIVLWGLTVWWIYFQDGADFLEKHPGLFGQRRTGSFSGRNDGTGYPTARMIKRFVPLMLLGGMVGMGMMWYLHLMGQ